MSYTSKPLESRSDGMFIEFVEKSSQPCKGGMFISTVAKTLSKTAKLTPMVRLGNRTYRAWMNGAVNAI